MAHDYVALDWVMLDSSDADGLSSEVSAPIPLGDNNSAQLEVLMPVLTGTSASFLLQTSPNPGGTATWSVPLSLSGLAGASFYNQAFALDPLANPAGIVASNGAAGVVGTR